jgi:hypothetical protein
MAALVTRRSEKIRQERIFATIEGFFSAAETQFRP